MYEIIVALLLVAVVIVMLMLIVYAFTDMKDQKRLQEETYAELRRRDEAYKKYKEKEKEADEQKKKLHEGTTADQFDHSIDIMHNLSRKDHH